jgi:hypothetical protein
LPAASLPRPESTLSPGGQNVVIHALVVHSPLVGPSTVTALAAELDAEGWCTSAPDLRSANEAPAQFWSLAVAVCPSADVVIGHSGAGAFLPVIAARVDARATIFVDAVLPGDEELFRPSASFIALLDTVPSTDGRLAPWDQWWPRETISKAIPDPVVRDRIVSEIPQVPRSFYDAPVPLPARWWTRPAGYIQLSPAYDDERTRAEQWGWPTLRRAGQHLDMVTKPRDIARDVVMITEQLARHSA